MLQMKEHGCPLANNNFKKTDDEVLATFANAKRRPNCSKSLQLRVVDVCQEEGTVTLTMTGTDDWINPMGHLQGGYLSTMLDECMSVAGIVASEFTRSVPNSEMKTTYLRPAKPGSFKAIGKAVKCGKSISFLEGTLIDEDGRIVAKASATATQIPIPGRK